MSKPLDTAAPPPGEMALGQGAQVGALTPNPPPLPTYVPTYPRHPSLDSPRTPSPCPAMAKRGLYSNIHDKRERIKAGSGEKMRKPGSKGAPTAAAFKAAAKTAKKRK